MMLSRLILLVCAATVASADRNAIDDIYTILKNLHVPPETSEFLAICPPKEIIKDAIEYAYRYSIKLDVYSGPSLYSNDHDIWHPTLFEQRVHNFQWGHMPEAEKYHAIARALIQLLKLVKIVWGGSGGPLEKVAAELRLKDYPPTNQIISDLEEIVRELCGRYKFHDVAPPGSLFKAPPTMGHGMKKSTPDDAATRASMQAQREIKAILRKLFVFTETSREYHTISEPKMIIESALGYAFLYWVALTFDAKDDRTSPSVVDSGAWHPTKFERRVENFGWQHLQPEAKKYHAMAKVLLKLLELIEQVWGGKCGVLKKLEKDFEHFPNTAEIKGELKYQAEQLSLVYKFNNVAPPGPPL